MKTVADVIGVTRSNLIEPVKARPRGRLGRPPLPADDLMAAIRAVIADLPTYGYRRVHAILRRKALAEGRSPPSPKRVYRVMKEQGSYSSAMPAEWSAATRAGSLSPRPTCAGARMRSRSGARAASGSVWRGHHRRDRGRGGARLDGGRCRASLRAGEPSAAHD